MNIKRQVIFMVTTLLGLFLVLLLISTGTGLQISHAAGYDANQKPDGQVFQTRPLDGLVAYYPFLTTAHTAESWFVILDESVPSGAALEFDGIDDQLNMGTSDTLMLSDTSFTVEAWISTTHRSVGWILGKHDPGWGNGYGLMTNHQDCASNKACFDIAGDHMAAISTSDINDGIWHHIAGVYDVSGTKRIYVDGILEDAKSAPVSIPPNTAPFRVGYVYDDHSREQYKGLIDEVRVWNVARTEAEIRSTMNIPLIGTEPGLVGYWKLDEGSGQTAFDSTAYGNNGQLGSTPGVDDDDPSWSILGVVQVDIDIIPTKYPNIVYPTITDPKDYKGLILVSVLTTPDFNARTVDPTTVRFGPAGASAIQSRGIIKDVDRDGDLDITFAFRIVHTGIKCGDTSASLSGATFDGQPFIGTDSIQTEGCSGYDIDRAALLALYESTNGDGWWNNSGWLTDTNHCIWQGVACDETGRVQHLYLNSNNLSGTIPPKLGNLQKLQRLDLSTNHINGPIPPELGNLQDLNYIGLHDNQVSGTIPPELGNLLNLGSLYLNYNQLSGSIPSELGTLWNLEFLNLNNNNLSGPIPPELGNLQNLQGLELDNNQINGSIPPELGNLQNLNYISLRNNQLNGPIPSELGNLQNLNFISLSDNKLNGPIPPELGDLQNMFHLSLENNQLSGTIPLELSNPQNLWFIILNNNQLSGSIPPELSNLQHLNGLNLSNNQLSGSIPPELGNMQSLIELNLSNNQLSGPIPPELGNMQNLHVLELSTNQLSGSTPPELGNLLSLNILEVSSNQLSGSIPPELGNLQWVYELDLSNNQLSGPIPLELGNMRRLSILYLYPGNGGLICVSNPDLWAFLSSLGDYSGPGYCPPPPYYTALLHSPGVFKIVSTFGLLSAGLMLGLGLVIGFPVRRYRHHEKQ